MLSAKLFSLCLLVLGLACEIFSSSDKMKSVSEGFMRVLGECKQELNISENLMADFMHFWREEYELVHRDTGCVLLCMSRKLNLLDTDGKLHHGNAAEFAQTHGADSSMASKLVELLHTCENQVVSMEDDCDRTLEIAKCFRTKIHELDWAPSMKTIVESVLTEI